jgi:hypothetical protein
VGRPARRHIGTMDALLPLLALLATLAIVWNFVADRQAAEQATTFARRACEEAGVLWLDQTAQPVRKRLARNTEGRLCWRRDFDFEFTTTGNERHLGRVSLVGRDVVGVVGPPPRVPTVFGFPGTT